MSFELRPLDPDRSVDVELVAAWMNDPVVARFWELDGPIDRTTDHLANLGGHVTPYIGVLDGVPMSYWELYRADLDPLAGRYQARPHDGGIHLLLGPPDYRGRGIGSRLIGEVAALMLAEDPEMTRVVAEPDRSNRASIRAFEHAGFVNHGEVELPDKRAALLVHTAVLDLAGIGIGPFNLSLAALADAVPDLHARFFDENDRWEWHPGLLFDDARLQVPFLADLVTLVDPTSRWSFLNYLAEHRRLFPFYFAERFHVPRREYAAYCRWVADQLAACTFAEHVRSCEWDGSAFRLETGTGQVRARNVVLGIGTEPVIPDCFSRLNRDRVIPAGDYLFHKHDLPITGDITVIGSGQTGAEIVLDLLRTRGRSGRTLRWLTRSPAFAPMEYSKLGLEHFTPDYTRYFHGLPGTTRRRLLREQWQLYKAISVDTIAEIYDLLYELSIDGPVDVTLLPGVEVRAAEEAGDAGLELTCHHRESGRDFAVRTDAVVLATGFTAREPAVLHRIRDFIERDDNGDYLIDENYRVVTTPEITGNLYVQNAETHTHGVGAPDLGLGAYRSAVILNDIAGRPAYDLPDRTAFTTFGLEKPDEPTSRP